jgi:phosphoglycolate phosphatase
MLRLKGDFVAKASGIIFDMDNTLLRSNIDFGRMKEAIIEVTSHYNLFHEEEVDLSKHTASTLIELAKQNPQYNENMDRLIWVAVGRVEKEGMEEAGLEADVIPVLESLSETHLLTICTNNAREAAIEALTRTEILSYFDLVAGREQMTKLKPSPSGIHYILTQYPSVPIENWVMIGDSWIDAKAATDAGIQFIGYGEVDQWTVEELRPAHCITMWKNFQQHIF